MMSISDNFKLRLQSNINLIKTANGDIVVNEENPFEIECRKLRQKLEWQEKSRFEEGYEAGLNEAKGQYDEELRNLKNDFALFRSEIAQIFETYGAELENQCRDEIVKLSLGIGEKVIASELAQRDVTADAVKKIIGSGASLKDAKIFVSRESFENVSSLKEECLPPNVVIEIDPMLKKGDCRLDCAMGIIDGTVAGRLAALKEDLSDYIGQD